MEETYKNGGILLRSRRMDLDKFDDLIMFIYDQQQNEIGQAAAADQK